MLDSAYTYWRRVKVRACTARNRPHSRPFESQRRTVSATSCARSLGETESPSAHPGSERARDGLVWHPAASWMVRRLMQPVGLRIADLAEQAGYSERQMSGLFRRWVDQFAPVRDDPATAGINPMVWALHRVQIGS